MEGDYYSVGWNG